MISHTSRAGLKQVRYPQSAAMAAQQQYVCSPVFTNPQKIVLIVDDNPNDRFLLRHAFEKAELPCKVVEAADGLEAINYLGGEPPYSDRTRYPLPDLVVLDLTASGSSSKRGLNRFFDERFAIELPGFFYALTRTAADLSRAIRAIRRQSAGVCHAG